MSNQHSLIKQTTDLHMCIFPTTARLGREIVSLNGFTHNPLQVHDPDLVYQKYFFLLFSQLFCITN